LPIRKPSLIGQNKNASLTWENKNSLCTDRLTAMVWGQFQMNKKNNFLEANLAFQQKVFKTYIAEEHISQKACSL